MIPLHTELGGLRFGVLRVLGGGCLHVGERGERSHDRVPMRALFGLGVLKDAARLELDHRSTWNVRGFGA